MLKHTKGRRFANSMPLGWKEMREGMDDTLDYIPLKMGSGHSVQVNCTSMKNCQLSVESLLMFRSDNYAETFKF